MTPASNRGLSPEPDDGMVRGCLIDVYDDGIVMRPKHPLATLEFSHNAIIVHEGEDMPEELPNEAALGLRTSGI